MNLFSKTILITLLLSSCNARKETVSNKFTDTAMKNNTEIIQKSENEWKQVLTPVQFKVLREKGTEQPYSGEYYRHTENGIYICAACGNELFSSKDKFDAGCGWPSFSDALDNGKIKTIIDSSHGMIRTEIICGKCGGHLGHVFNDGPTPTGLRYCVNSVSLDFKKK